MKIGRRSQKVILKNPARQGGSFPQRGHDTGSRPPPFRVSRPRETRDWYVPYALFDKGLCNEGRGCAGVRHSRSLAWLQADFRPAPVRTTAMPPRLIEKLLVTGQLATIQKSPCPCLALSRPYPNSPAPLHTAPG